MRRLDPTLLLVLLLALAALGFAYLEVGHQATIRALQRQAEVNAAAIRQNQALLQEVRSDEARYCAAARLGGDARIIAVVCPKAGDQ